MIPPNYRVETKLSNLAKILYAPPQSARSSLRAFSAAGFVCLELRGLKQAGGFTAGDPLASSPYPKAFRVSTSRGRSTESMWNLKTSSAASVSQPCPYCFVHLRTGNQEYYKNISQNARIIFGGHKKFHYRDFRIYRDIRDDWISRL